VAQGELPWLKTSQSVLHDYGIFKSRELISRGPHGKEGRFIVLDAPDWAVVVPAMIHEGKRCILTIRQYRHGAGEACAEFPGGVIEPGEEPAAAAARELLEETGYRAGRVIALGSCYPNPAFMSNRLHIFAAEELEARGGQELDEHELVDLHIEPEDEVLKALGDPPWSHALMATAAWYYARYRAAAEGAKAADGGAPA
jgi:8-oxo-dGTP pyrophosphatase MutT (NUDIX family)